jgi:lambda family phage portal protein
MRKTQVKILGKKVAVPWNAVDRVVDYLSPQRGDARYVARFRAAMYGGSGGYAGADKSRPANVHGNIAEMDADSAILPDLQTLRESSQNLARNNCLAAGALDTSVARVVGNGIFPKPKIDRTVLNLSDEEAEKFEETAEKEYLRVTETREFDAERHVPFSVWQGMAWYSTLRDGDSLVNLPRFSRPGSDAMLKVQLIPAARLSNPRGQRDTRRMVAGVSKDQWGAPVKYHVSRFHPGNRLGYRYLDKKTEQWQTLAAFDNDGSPLALHLYDKKEGGQTRGVPYLSPVIELIKQLGRYTDSEVMAAVVSAMLTLFVESEAGGVGIDNRGTEVGATNGEVADDLKKVDFDMGAIVGLPAGKKITVAESKRPSENFEPFFKAICDQIGVALGQPGILLIKDFSAANYSSMKAAFEDAWAFFMSRRTWLVKMLCQPVYELVIAEAVAHGRLSAPGFYRSDAVRRAWVGAQWIGDAKPVIDEAKTVKAAVEMIEADISTVDEQSRKLTGIPLAEKLPQILKERRQLRDAGRNPDEVFIPGEDND